ncbi:MAG: abortive infection family protein [Polyangiaceae bacterium]
MVGSRTFAPLGQINLPTECDPISAILGGVTEVSPPKPSVISEVTRRNLFDALQLAHVHWSGRMQEDDFLARIYDLKKMPSNDHRFPSAAGDIWQHRVRNNDWDAYWVFTDARFDLMWCADEDLLRFFCETLHPVVRSDPEEVDRLVEIYNEHFGKDGWEVFPETLVSGRPVFAGRRKAIHLDHAVASVKAAIEPFGAEYLSRQITRMYAATENDPELAIGTAKELLETVCKSILVDRTGAVDGTMELPALVKTTAKQLQLAPEDVPDSAKGAETIRILLNSLGTVTAKLAELRNLYGTGHGKNASVKVLHARHAKLAVGAAATLATFLFETHQDRVIKN